MRDQLIFYLKKYGCVILMVFAWMLFPGNIIAETRDNTGGKRIEKDTNEDKITDQIAFFDSRGRILRMEIDANGVGHLPFEKKGMHLLYAKHKLPAENDPYLDYMQFMTFLTFEVK